MFDLALGFDLAFDVGVAATVLLRLLDSRTASNGALMLPGFRFFIGATLAIALLGVVAIGLQSTVQLSRLAKLSPLDASRSLAYAERRGWKGSVDPELMRVFEAVAQNPGDHNESVVTVSAPQPAVMAAAPPLTAEDDAADTQPASAVASLTAVVDVPVTASADTASAEEIARDSAAPAAPMTSVSHESVLPADQPVPENEAPAIAVLPPQVPSAVAAAAAHTKAVMPAAEALDAQPADTSAALALTDTKTRETMETASGDPPAQAPSAQPLAQVSQQSAEDEIDQDVDQHVGRLASVSTAESSGVGEEQSEQQNAAAPQAATLNVLPRPMPKSLRMRHVRVKARAPRGKIVKSGVVRPRIVRARTVRTAKGKFRALPKSAQNAGALSGQQNSWTGYQVTPQARTSWGWTFNK